MASERPPLGRAVSERRKALGLSQATLAEIAGVSTGTITKIERGAVAQAQPKTWLPLERALGWVSGSLPRIQSGEDPIEAAPLGALRARLDTIMWAGDSDIDRVEDIKEYIAFVEASRNAHASRDGHFTIPPPPPPDPLPHHVALPPDVLAVVSTGTIVDHLVGRRHDRPNSNLTIVTLLIKLDPDASLENSDLELVTEFSHIKDKIKAATAV